MSHFKCKINSSFPKQNVSNLTKHVISKQDLSWNNCYKIRCHYASNKKKIGIFSRCMRQYLSSSLEDVIGIERNVCSLSVQSNIKNHYSAVYNIILNDMS